MIHAGRDHSSAARPAAFDDEIVALDRAVDAGLLETGGGRSETIALLGLGIRLSRACAVEAGSEGGG